MVTVKERRKHKWLLWLGYILLSLVPVAIFIGYDNPVLIIRAIIVFGGVGWWLIKRNK